MECDSYEDPVSDQARQAFFFGSGLLLAWGWKGCVLCSCGIGPTSSLHYSSTTYMLVQFGHASHIPRLSCWNTRRPLSLTTPGLVFI